MKKAVEILENRKGFNAENWTENLNLIKYPEIVEVNNLFKKMSMWNVQMKRITKYSSEIKWVRKI